MVQQLPKLFLRGRLCNETMVNLDEEQKKEVGDIINLVSNDPNLQNCKFEFCKALSRTIKGDYIDIDAGIGILRNRILGQTDLTSGVLAILPYGFPWLNPWQAALLKFADDLVCDTLVEVDLAAALRLCLLFPALSLSFRHFGLLVICPNPQHPPRRAGWAAKLAGQAPLTRDGPHPPDKDGSEFKKSCGLEGGTTGRPGLRRDRVAARRSGARPDSRPPREPGG